MDSIIVNVKINEQHELRRKRLFETRVSETGRSWRRRGGKIKLESDKTICLCSKAKGKHD